MLQIQYNRNNLFAEKKYIIEDVFSNKESIYIFGITTYTEIICNFLRSKDILIKGIIDDITKNETFLEILVVKLHDVDINSIIISSIIEGRPYTVNNILKERGYIKILSYFDFNYLDPIFFKIPFNQNNYFQIQNNLEKLNYIYDLLIDIKSKKILEKLIDFRINFNYEIKHFHYSLENQYFEDFIDFNSITSFVDGGGFDGKTTKMAFNYFQNLKKVYYFEPFLESMNISKQNLQNEKDMICFYQKALSEKKAETFITQNNGSANYISSNGTLKIETINLDNVINEKIDLIKLDIEGEELNALKGARRIITEYKPKIAVCIYHKQEHFWDIPLYLLELNSQYKIYLRHYTEGIYESVMYFI